MIDPLDVQKIISNRKLAERVKAQVDAANIVLQRQGKQTISIVFNGVDKATLWKGRPEDKDLLLRTKVFDVVLLWLSGFYQGLITMERKHE